MSEKHAKGYHGALFWVFVVCFLAVLALYFVVRPAELSTDQNVIDAVKALAAASVAIFLATSNQVANLVPAQRKAFRPFIWGLLLALTMSAAVAIPIVIIAWGYFSDKALILLGGLVVLELLLFILLVLSKFEPAQVPVAQGENHPWEVPPAVPATPAEPPAPTQVIPPVQLAPEEVARYEEATLDLEQATREQEEATREADDLARRYEQAMQGQQR